MGKQYKYIDLTIDCDLSKYSISSINEFECAILDDDKNRFNGFILAKSPTNKALTICDVDFHYSDTDKKYATRLTFRRTSSDFEDKGVPSGRLKQRISFHSGKDGYREFWKMIAFLEKFRDVVDTGVFFGDYRVVSKDDILASIKGKVGEDRVRYVVDLIEKVDFGDGDLEKAIMIKERTRDLDVFKRLLDNKDSYRDKYRTHYGISKQGDEAIWHHFFLKHKWIFGLGLDLRFLRDFIDEANLGGVDTSGKGSPVVDYLALSDYTVLIEIKTPEGKYFSQKKQTTGRANSWSFSREFIDAVSQCLAQKDGFLKSVAYKQITDNKGDIVNKDVVRTVDPKMIFVYGRKDCELPLDSQSEDIGVKRDTLERFCRDSRNITFISFDELFERAKRIVDSE